MGGLAMSDNNLTPRIEQLAPELEKIISNLGADPAPCRWLRRDAGPGRGTAVVGGGRLPLVQRHPQQPSHEVPPGKRRFAVSRTDQSRQRPDPRPAGTTRRLRALRPAPGCLRADWCVSPRPPVQLLRSSKPKLARTSANPPTG